LLKKSIENGIEINYIKNNKDNKKMGHILDIEIECLGSYKNIIGFINAIEENTLIVDVYKIALESEKNLVKGNIKVSVWGINY